jgi:mRNA-degrading endonuclease RelE of RelBE toxin-antitoxin system
MRAVRFERGHEAELLRWPPAVKARLRDALRSLAKDPTGRKAGLDVKELQVPGGPRLYRCAVGGYRIAFLVQPDQLRVVRIFHRSQGYAWLDP